MTSSWWREAFKFLAGAEFAGSLANAYLYAYKIRVPFLSYTISPTLLGVRALVSFALFLVFLSFGYIKTGTQHDLP